MVPLDFIRSRLFEHSTPLFTLITTYPIVLPVHSTCELLARYSCLQVIRYYGVHDSSYKIVDNTLEITQVAITVASERLVLQWQSLWHLTWHSPICTALSMCAIASDCTRKTRGSSVTASSSPNGKRMGKVYAKFGGEGRLQVPVSH